VKIIETKTTKRLVSPLFNYYFDKTTGFMATWGNTKEDNPNYSPYGPTIADIELTTSCTGPGGKICKFCYKNNTPAGESMSFDTFVQVFNKLPRTLTQIAFGVDANATQNKDLWRIMSYCRDNEYNKVVPNITVADITDETADNLVKYCGAVAVSRYDNKNFCYDSVKKLTDRGLQQTNIHQLLSKETLAQALETIDDIKNDPRLAKLNAVVFLSLKQKNRGIKFTRLTDEEFKMVVDKAFDKNINFGFDSCGCNKFLRSVKDHPKYNELEVLAEPCESSCFSLYINHKGQYYPCSFAESGMFDKGGDWVMGIDLTNPEMKDFISDVWNNNKTEHFRKALLENLDERGVRSCPLYKI
jgi:hypothetical protein